MLDKSDSSLVNGRLSSPSSSSHFNPDEFFPQLLKAVHYIKRQKKGVPISKIVTERFIAETGLTVSNANRVLKSALEQRILYRLHINNTPVSYNDPAQLRRNASRIQTIKRASDLDRLVLKVARELIGPSASSASQPSSSTTSPKNVHKITIERWKHCVLDTYDLDLQIGRNQKLSDAVDESIDRLLNEEKIRILPDSKELTGPRRQITIAPKVNKDSHNKINAAHGTCLICSKPLVTKKMIIRCTNCAEPAHHYCTGVGDNLELSWYCIDCAECCICCKNIEMHYSKREDYFRCYKCVCVVHVKCLKAKAMSIPDNSGDWMCTYCETQPTTDEEMPNGIESPQRKADLTPPPALHKINFNSTSTRSNGEPSASVRTKKELAGLTDYLTGYFTPGNGGRLRTSRKTDQIEPLSINVEEEASTQTKRRRDESSPMDNRKRLNEKPPGAKKSRKQSTSTNTSYEHPPELEMMNNSKNSPDINVSTVSSTNKRIDQLQDSLSTFFTPSSGGRTRSRPEAGSYARMVTIGQIEDFKKSSVSPKFNEGGSLLNTSPQHSPNNKLPRKNRHQLNEKISQQTKKIVEEQHDPTSLKKEKKSSSKVSPVSRPALLPDLKVEKPKMFGNGIATSPIDIDVPGPSYISDSENERFKSAHNHAASAFYGNSKKKDDRTGVSIVKINGMEIDCWYTAPYPHEINRQMTVYLCRHCLSYFVNDTELNWHKNKCHLTCPPGDEIYRDTNAKVRVFEVDGDAERIYCQNVCLLAKLFLDHKTLFLDVDKFLFYVLCRMDDQDGCTFVGYFSKEKFSMTRYNLSCIVTLPCYQKLGYGRFLIDFSYLLSRVENTPGTPERPLSTFGFISYYSYWKSTILEYIGDHCTKLSKITIRNISKALGIGARDVAETLEKLDMLRDKGSTIELAVNWEMVARAIAKRKEALAKKRRIDVDGKYLKWQPPAPPLSPTSPIPTAARDKPDLSPLKSPLSPVSSPTPLSESLTNIRKNLFSPELPTLTLPTRKVTLESPQKKKSAQKRIGQQKLHEALSRSRHQKKKHVAPVRRKLPDPPPATLGTRRQAALTASRKIEQVKYREITDDSDSGRDIISSDNDDDDEHLLEIITKLSPDDQSNDHHSDEWSRCKPNDLNVGCKRDDTSTSDEEEVDNNKPILKRNTRRSTPQPEKGAKKNSPKSTKPSRKSNEKSKKGSKSSARQQVGSSVPRKPVPPKSRGKPMKILQKVTQEAQARASEKSVVERARTPDDRAIAEPDEGIEPKVTPPTPPNVSSIDDVAPLLDAESGQLVAARTADIEKEANEYDADYDDDEVASHGSADAPPCLQPHMPSNEDVPPTVNTPRAAPPVPNPPVAPPKTMPAKTSTAALAQQAPIVELPPPLSPMLFGGEEPPPVALAPEQEESTPHVHAAPGFDAVDALGFDMINQKYKKTAATMTAKTPTKDPTSTQSKATRPRKKRSAGSSASATPNKSPDKMPTLSSSFGDSTGSAKANASKMENLVNIGGAQSDSDENHHKAVANTTSNTPNAASNAMDVLHQQAPYAAATRDSYSSQITGDLAPCSQQPQTSYQSMAPPAATGTHQSPIAALTSPPSCAQQNSFALPSNQQQPLAPQTNQQTASRGTSASSRPSKSRSSRSTKNAQQPLPSMSFDLKQLAPLAGVTGAAPYYDPSLYASPWNWPMAAPGQTGVAKEAEMYRMFENQMNSYYDPAYMQQMMTWMTPPMTSVSSSPASTTQTHSSSTSRADNTTRNPAATQNPYPPNFDQTNFWASYGYPYQLYPFPPANPATAPPQYR